jgi:hypothetical protein
MQIRKNEAHTDITLYNYIKDKRVYVNSWNIYCYCN